MTAPFQFGLKTLLAAFTVLAVLLAAWQTLARMVGVALIVLPGGILMLAFLILPLVGLASELVRMSPRQRLTSGLLPLGLIAGIMVVLFVLIAGIVVVCCYLMGVR